MIDVELYDINTNKPLDTILRLAQPPCYGDYIMDTKEVLPDWKNHIFSVKGVTYFDGGKVIIHVDKYDPERTKKGVEKVLRRFTNDAMEQEDSEEKAS